MNIPISEITDIKWIMRLIDMGFKETFFSLKISSVLKKCFHNKKKYKHRICEIGIPPSTHSEFLQYADSYINIGF